MRSKLLVPSLLVVVTTIAACHGDTSGPSKEDIAYGTSVAVGNGTARSYLISSGGTPTEIGIAMSEEALDGLPGGSSPLDAKSFILPLPNDNPTGFRVVELNWNPGGHPPPMVYTVPHFDFHFYRIPLTARDAILPTDPAFGQKAASLPARAGLPAGYTPDATPGGAILGIPKMGVHWSDKTSHEFHGQPFTATFIVGSWDGAYTFLEPMVELAFLESKPNLESDIDVPSSFGAPGDRPTAYRVSWNADAKEFRIGLMNLGGH